MLITEILEVGANVTSFQACVKFRNNNEVLSGLYPYSK